MIIIYHTTIQTNAVMQICVSEGLEVMVKEDTTSNNHLIEQSN